MLVRFAFFGLGHGWVAIMGPYSASIGGDTRQQEVIGMVLAAGTGMQLVGPAISGMTYNLLPSFPALVPSLLGSCLAVVSGSLFLCLKTRAPQAVSEAESSQDEAEGPAEGPESMSRSSIGEMLRRWPVPLVIFMRFSQGFAQFAIFEVAPLWLISDPEVGGLGMNEKQVGLLLARSGLWNIFYFSFILPRMTSFLGGRRCSLLVSLLGILFSILLPFSTTELPANVLHLLATSACLSQAALNIAFTNNAAGVKERAIVSGIAVTMDTVGKALAPIVTSSLFAWSLNAFGKQGHGLVFYIQVPSSSQKKTFYYIYIYAICGYITYMYICTSCAHSHGMHTRGNFSTNTHHHDLAPLEWSVLYSCFHAACFVMSAHEAVANMTHTMGRYPALSELATGTYIAIHPKVLESSMHPLSRLEAGLSLVNLLCTLLLPASVENQVQKAKEESSEGAVYGASETSQDESTADSRC